MSGAARTILLFHTISTRPAKQSRMVGSTLGVYSFGLIFVSARTNKRHHHQNVNMHVGVSNMHAKIGRMLTCFFFRTCMFGV
jgi:hypothetical protein